MTIGEELRAYRQSQGLTLAQMGERLDATAPFVCNVERDKRPMPAHWLAHLPGRFDSLYVEDQVDRARWKALENARLARSPLTAA